MRRRSPWGDFICNTMRERILVDTWVLRESPFTVEGGPPTFQDTLDQGRVERTRGVSGDRRDPGHSRSRSYGRSGGVSYPKTPVGSESFHVGDSGCRRCVVDVVGGVGRRNTTTMEIGKWGQNKRRFVSRNSLT